MLAAYGFTIVELDSYVFYKSDYMVCVYVNDFLIMVANLHKIK